MSRLEEVGVWSRLGPSAGDGVTGKRRPIAGRGERESGEDPLPHGIDARRPRAADDWVEMTRAARVAVEEWTDAFCKSKVTVEEDAALLEQGQVRCIQPSNRPAILARRRNIGVGG